jgi:hypothetical protein
MKNNLEREGFILTYCFKGFTPWSLGSIVSEFMHSKVEHRGREYVVEKSG